MLGLRLIATFLIGHALVMQGCITAYELDADRTGGILAINGRITNDTGSHYVHLTRTSEKTR